MKRTPDVYELNAEFLRARGVMSGLMLEAAAIQRRPGTNPRRATIDVQRRALEAENRVIFLAIILNIPTLTGGVQLGSVRLE